MRGKFVGKLDLIHEQMTGEPPPEKTHICVGCGELTSKCKCDPSGGREYETGLAFRQFIREKLNSIENDVSSIRSMIEEIYEHLP